MRLPLFVALLLGTSCGNSKQPVARPDLCDVLDTLATTSKRFRDGARAELAALDEEVENWRRFEHKEFTPEEDGSGKFSGARQAAYAHHKSIMIWCNAALAVRNDMVNLTNASQIADVQVAARELENRGPYSCYEDDARENSQSWDPAKRQSAAQALTTWSSQATVDERALVAACRSKLGPAK
jgi:hypothetical protein